MLNLRRKIVIGTIAFITAAACERRPEAARSATELVGCEQCDISIEHVATLGSATDTISPTLFSFVTRQPNGTFVVTGSDHPGVQLKYGSDGALLTTFGRPGSGPGEYGFLTMPIVGPGDTLAIHDQIAHRRTVLNSESQAVRYHRVPGGADRLTWHGERLLATARSHGGTRAVSIYILESQDGSVADSLVIPLTAGMSSEATTAVLAPVRDGSLLVALSNALVFTRYDADLRQLDTIDLTTSWFPPNAGGSGNPTVESPEPRLVGAWASNDTILWAVTITADNEWVPSAQEGERPVRLSDAVGWYDWIVAAFHLNSRKELARVRLDGQIMLGQSDGILYSPRELPDGRLVVDAYRPRLRH